MAGVKSLFDRLNKVTGNSIEVMGDSPEKYTPRHYVDSGNVVLNVQMSGRTDGGFPSNRSLMLIGEASSGKSLLAKIFMLKYQALGYSILYLDSEGDVDMEDFETFGLNTDEIGIFKEIYTVEQLKFKIMQCIDNITLNDRVFIVVDSIGNLPSDKEVKSAMDEDNTADMTRARAINSLYRCALKPAFDKQIPILWVAREYDKIDAGKFATTEEKKEIGGGKGQKFSPSIILSLATKDLKKAVMVMDDEGKSTERKVPVGVRFNSVARKNRMAKRNTSIHFDCSYKSGLLKYSGLVPWAITGGFIERVKAGEKSFIYKIVHSGEETKNINGSQWELILKNGFEEWLNDEFKYKSLFSADDEFNGDDIDEDDDTKKPAKPNTVNKTVEKTPAVKEAVKTPVTKTSNAVSTKKVTGKETVKCLSCKKEVKAKNVKYELTSKGANMMKAECSVCGRKHCLMVKK